jgi:hypothetical protein
MIIVLHAQLLTLANKYRRMWSWVPVWSQIEVDVGIVVASLPSLHPLVQQVWKGFSTTRRLTPSQLPDFPEYHGSEITLMSSEVVDMEKSLKASEVSFYDEASDAEDDIDKAKTVEARTEVKSLPTGKKRLWRRQK